MNRLFVCILLGYVLNLQTADITINDRDYLCDTEFTTRWSGFIRNDVFANTRQVVSFARSTIPTIPLPPRPDVIGCDINAVGNIGMTPLRSFIRLDAWGVKCGRFYLHSGYQFTFLGLNEFTAGNINLWHAYMQLIHEKDRIVMGLYRHPFGILRVFPRSYIFNIASIAVAPQLRWWHSWGVVQTLITLYGQLIDTDYGQARSGEIVPSPLFIQNSGKPGLSLRLQAATPLYVVGCGIDVYQLLPRLQSNTGYSTTQTTNIVNGTVYAALDSRDLWIKAQGFFGEDFVTNTLLGGYALSACNAQTNVCQYTHIPTATIRFDMEWRRHPIIHPGLFVGWATTLKTNQPLYISPVTNKPVFFGPAADLHRIERVGIRCEVDIEPLRFGLEWDFTRAVWGPLNAWGTTNQPMPIGVGRLLFVSWCDF